MGPVPILRPLQATSPYSLSLSFFPSKMGIINTYFEGCVGRMKEDQWKCLTQDRCSKVVSSLYLFISQILLTTGLVPASVHCPGVNDE